MAGRIREGFTLLEMLVALAIVSVLALSLHSSLRTCFKARESAEAALGPAGAAAAAIAFLRADLEAALPPTGLLAGQFIGEDATGEDGLAADTVFFNTASGVSDILYPEDEFDTLLSLLMSGEEDAGQVEGGVQEVEYALVSGEEDDEGSSLVRYVVKNLLSPTTVEPREQIVCKNVRSFDVWYLRGSEWVESWDSGQEDNALPAAIEFTLELEPDFEEAESRKVTVLIALPCSSTSEEEENRFIR